MIKKNRTVYSILLLLCVIGFWCFENFYTPATYGPDKEEALGRGEDDVTFLLPKITDGELVKHQYYTLSYKEKYEQAEWVVYSLTKEMLTYDDRKRPYFIEDPKVKTKSADYRNYKGSGYDRGHLCAAGDRRFSEQAYNETFYTSNITPQKNDFNSGIWNNLEKKVRQWAKMYGTVQVITAGVLTDGLSVIGDEDVAVPKYYYKIVVRKEGSRYVAIAFLFPHEQSNKSLQGFVVSIDTIEKYTGIDFFPNLPDEQERTLEKEIELNYWKW